MAATILNSERAVAMSVYTPAAAIGTPADGSGGGSGGKISGGAPETAREGRGGGGEKGQTDDGRAA